MSSPRLLVIDGFSLMFRAFYALPPTMTWNGNPVNAVFGFTNLMLQAVDNFSPTHVCICFDRKEPTFRHEEYPEYKAHRPPPPEAFSVQVPVLRELIEKLKVPVMDKAGFEADDLMGTLSRLCDENQWECLLLTGDQDAFQLVSDYTSVVMNDRKTGTLKQYTPDAVKEKMGFGPERVIHFKSLKGDSSDNIPGVPGVGDKTAQTLLEQFSSLEEMYDKLEQVKSDKLRAKLALNKEQAYLSYRLATIHRHVPLDLELEHCLFQPDWAHMIDILKEYEFKQIVRRLENKRSGSDQVSNKVASPSVKKPDGAYTLIQELNAVEALLPTLKEGFAIDLETTSKEPQSAQIVGIAIATKEAEAVYIACNHYLEPLQQTQTLSLFGDDDEVEQPVFKTNPILECLKPLLEDASIPKYTHNGKYERSVFAQYTIALNGITFDTMLAAHLLYPLDRVGLKALAKEHLGIEMTDYEEVAGSGKSQVTFDQVPLEKALHYAAADADMTLRLTRYFEPKVKEKELDTLLYNIELPVQDVLSDMETTGVNLDTDYLETLHREFSGRLAELEKAIYQLAGTTFNINSPKQLSDILFGQLQLPVIKKTKTGLSTDASVLEALKDKHPVVEKLTEFRSLEKLVGTYVKALPELIHPRTKRVHTSFNQTIAQTGRLSSTHPNLQNIPIRTEDGLKIRRAFVPSTDNGAILSVDYSQIELRIMAHMAKDPNMIAAFQRGEDIHASTAAIINDITLDDVSKEQRYNAKAVNFGIIYGISPYGLSQNLGISTTEAKEIIDNYFAKFPNIKAFMDDSIAFAHRHAYVRTEWGRLRPLPEIHDRNKNRVQFSERIAVNTRVQGSAAEIMKIAMLKVNESMHTANVHSKMVIQVHDELVFDVIEAEKEKMLSLVRSTMETAVTLSVPLKVDAVLGANWEEIS